MSNILYSPNPNALESNLYNLRCGPTHARCLRDGQVYTFVHAEFAPNDVSPSSGARAGLSSSRQQQPSEDE
jgi:hypothetical protein